MYYEHLRARQNQCTALTPAEGRDLTWYRTIQTAHAVASILLNSGVAKCRRPPRRKRRTFIDFGQAFAIAFTTKMADMQCTLALNGDPPADHADVVAAMHAAGCARPAVPPTSHASFLLRYSHIQMLEEVGAAQRDVHVCTAHVNAERVESGPSTVCSGDASSACGSEAGGADAAHAYGAEWDVVAGAGDDGGHGWEGDAEVVCGQTGDYDCFAATPDPFERYGCEVPEELAFVDEDDVVLRY